MGQYEGVVGNGEQSSEYVEFWQAGMSVKGEFHCSECGYGVIVSRQLPVCPMCAGQSWEQSTWSPFARSAAARLD